MQAAITTISLNNTIVTRLNHTLSGLSSARKRLARDTLFHSLRCHRILAMTQPCTPEDKISKAKETHKIKGKLLHKSNPHDQLDMTRWRYTSHESLNINALRFPADSHFIRPRLSLAKLSSTQNNRITLL